MAEQRNDSSSDDLDVSLEPVSRKKSGGGWGTAITVLILIFFVAVIVLLVVRSEERIRAEEAQKREDARQMQLTAIGNDLQGAVDKLNQDDYAGAMQIVDKAGASLDSLIREAGDSKDTDALDLLGTRKRELDQAKASIKTLHEAFLKQAAGLLSEQATAISAGAAKEKKPAKGPKNEPKGKEAVANAVTEPAAPPAPTPAPAASPAPATPAPAAAPAPAAPAPVEPAPAPPAATPAPAPPG